MEALKKSWYGLHRIWHGDSAFVASKSFSRGNIEVISIQTWFCRCLCHAGDCANDGYQKLREILPLSSQGTRVVELPLGNARAVAARGVP